MHFFVGVAFVAALILLLFVQSHQTHFGFNLARQFLIFRRPAATFGQKDVGATVKLLFLDACVD
jgi:hypothetical protein